MLTQRLITTNWFTISYISRRREAARTTLVSRSTVWFPQLVKSDSSVTDTDSASTTVSEWRCATPRWRRIRLITFWLANNHSIKCGTAILKVNMVNQSEMHLPCQSPMRKTCTIASSARGLAWISAWITFLTWCAQSTDHQRTNCATGFDRTGLYISRLECSISSLYSLI